MMVSCYSIKMFCRLNIRVSSATGTTSSTSKNSVFYEEVLNAIRIASILRESMQALDQSDKNIKLQWMLESL